MLTVKKTAMRRKCDNVIKMSNHHTKLFLVQFKLKKLAEISFTIISDKCLHKFDCIME